MHAPLDKLMAECEAETAAEIKATAPPAPAGDNATAEPAAEPAGAGEDRSAAAKERVYATALAGALEELLSEYCQAICDAEAMFLDDPDTPMPQLEYELRDHLIVLPALHRWVVPLGSSAYCKPWTVLKKNGPNHLGGLRLVQQVETEGLLGGRLVDELANRARSGVPAVRHRRQFTANPRQFTANQRHFTTNAIFVCQVAAAFGRLHIAVLGALFRQLGNWAVRRTLQLPSDTREGL